MSHRFDFGRRSPITQLLDKANNLKRSLSSNADAMETNNHSTTAIINQATTILCHDFGKGLNTILNGESVAKIFLSLAYTKTSWSQLDDFSKIALIDSIHNHHTSMSAKDICNILWALARLGCIVSDNPSQYNIDRDTADCLLQTAHQAVNNDDCFIQTYSNILWSFAVLDFDYKMIEPVLSSFTHKIYPIAINDNELHECSDKEILQLKIFFQYYINQFSGLEQQCAHALQEFLDQRITKMPKPKSSQLHKEIESYISEYTSNKFASEVPIGGGYADICFTREKIIFEINGPSHYENDGVTLNAHSRFRQRIMEKSGYRIYHIHYAHWDNAKSKDDFICDLLEAAGLLTNFQIKIKNTTTISLSPLTTFSLPVDQLKITIKIPSEYKSRKRERDEADASDEDKIRKYPKFDD